MKSWFPILGAPAAWAAQGLLLWLVSSWGCEVSAPVRTLSLAITWVALVIALAALAAAMSGRQSSTRQWLPIEGDTRPDFTVDAAVLVSATFVIAALATALPVFMLSACEAIR